MISKYSLFGSKKSESITADALNVITPVILDGCIGFPAWSNIDEPSAGANMIVSEPDGELFSWTYAYTNVSPPERMAPV